MKKTGLAHPGRLRELKAHPPSCERAGIDVVGTEGAADRVHVAAVHERRDAGGEHDLPEQRAVAAQDPHPEIDRHGGQVGAGEGLGEGRERDADTGLERGGGEKSHRFRTRFAAGANQRRVVAGELDAGRVVAGEAVALGRQCREPARFTAGGPAGEGTAFEIAARQRRERRGDAGGGRAPVCRVSGLPVRGMRVGSRREFSMSRERSF
ncbi:MAG: hypothetical protein M5U09_06175 [Gammaproteobacteria bacterium]|nr:hypothetical protein [Gammaproteobacteria bacterium]